MGENVRVNGGLPHLKLLVYGDNKTAGNYECKIALVRSEPRTW
jgi:hypothetical protein